MDCNCGQEAHVWSVLEGDDPARRCYSCYGQLIVFGIREIQIPVNYELPENWRDRT